MMFNYNIPQDGMGNPAPSLDDFFVAEVAPDAFDGDTEDARGDHDGDGDPTTLFEVDGDVIVRIFGVVTDDLTGASATIEIGTSNNSAALIAQTTATDLDDGELWHDASPDANVEALTVAPSNLIVGGADIVETVGTANITGGNIRYVCLWRPVSRDGFVSPAV